LPNVKNDPSYLRIKLKTALKTGFEQSQFEQFTISPPEEAALLIAIIDEILE
jgi:hypothetical protein